MKLFTRSYDILVNNDPERSFKMKQVLKRGFTLIELLIVMAVVSILIAIIIPSYRGMQNDAWIAKAQKEVQTLQAAIESYYRYHNEYPTSLSDLTDSTKKHPKIIDKLLPDPWKTQTVDGVDTYGYVRVENLDGFGAYYIVFSKGIDGQDGDYDVNPSIDANNRLTIKGDDVVLTNLPTVKAAQ
jgi:type II secretion system protein G